MIASLWNLSGDSAALPSRSLAKFQSDWRTTNANPEHSRLCEILRYICCLILNWSPVIFWPQGIWYPTCYSVWTRWAPRYEMSWLLASGFVGRCTASLTLTERSSHRRIRRHWLHRKLSFSQIHRLGDLSVQWYERSSYYFTWGFEDSHIYVDSLW